MIVERILEVEIKERLEHMQKRDKNEIWVSELIQCKQKAKFTQEFPEIMTIEPRLILGKIVHQGLQKFLEEKFEADIEVECSKEIEEYIIKGRIDALTESRVIEIKYAQDVVGGKPYDHHIEQVKLYMWLTGRMEGILIYITPKRLLEFTIQTPATDDQVLWLIDNWRSPRYDWECKYCSFAVICPYAKNGR